MKRHIIGIFAVILVALAAVSACATGSGGTPGPAPSLRCIFECGPSTPAQPTVPVATADSNPKYPLGSNECVVRNVFVEMKDSLNVHGVFEVYCKRSPMVILVTARLEIKNSAGEWADEAPILVSHAIPVPDLAQKHEVVAACYPGWWRMEIHWSGLKADGTPFPNPRDGDSPPDRATNPVRIDC